MWLIDEEEFRFQNKSSEINEAENVLNEALKNKNLTLIIGNGVSRSTIWYQSEIFKSRGNNQSCKKVSWEYTVKDAAEKAGIKRNLIDNSNNYIALAQAVINKMQGNNKKNNNARKTLLGNLKEAFLKDLQTTHLDKMFVRLKPRDIVTTNYDLQLERAFDKSKQEYRTFIRHGEGRENKDEKTWIHKMHGSFMPKKKDALKYAFSEKFPRLNSINSIVITETDYDNCFKQLNDYDKTSSLLIALKRTCLIIGKRIDSQDLSFIYALRKTKNLRKQSNNKIYMLCNRKPTNNEELVLDNLGIIPLIINLPRKPKDGHYYFGLLATLSKLFPSLKNIYTQAKGELKDTFNLLVKKPNVISIGLASMNVTGRTYSKDANIIPPPGRRNLKYDEVEEHVGGAAMIPSLILSALDSSNRYNISIVSSIGKVGEAYSNEILKVASENNIDTDAVSLNQTSSWFSTVLVHNYKYKDEKTNKEREFKGQRIFLDQGYKNEVKLDETEFKQLKIQLNHNELKVLYLDKFLASQHPSPNTRDEIDSNKFGFLLKNEGINLLDTLITNNKSIDIVYETGTSGSNLQHVEKILSKYINIFTSGFPFFAALILYNIKNIYTTSFEEFSPKKQWWMPELKEEIEVIESWLKEILEVESLDKLKERVYMINLPEKLSDSVSYFVKRESICQEKSRRWYISTLHNYGAIGIDLIHKKLWYCNKPNNEKEIKNTSSAGDTFRGALVYYLLESNERNENELPKALLFATKVATERCFFFKMNGVYEHLNNHNETWLEEVKNEFDNLKDK